MAMPLIFASCSKDEEMASKETIQVSFSTEQPKRIGTRAGTTDLNVNKVAVSYTHLDVYKRQRQYGVY